MTENIISLFRVDVNVKTAQLFKTDIIGGLVCYTSEYLHKYAQRNEMHGDSKSPDTEAPEYIVHRKRRIGKCPTVAVLRVILHIVWSAVLDRSPFYAFEMKGLRKILRVSWTAKKTNEWVLN